MEMKNKTCKDCLHCSIEDANEVYCSGMPWHYPFGGSDTVTLDKEACEHFLERDKPTLFHCITASVEVLAEKFIFKEWHPIARCYVWYSLLFNSEERLIYAPAFDTKAEAFDATVKKLKEVYNETTGN